MVAVGSGVSVEKMGIGVAFNKSSEVQDVSIIVIARRAAARRHLRRTPVQVSNPQHDGEIASSLISFAPRNDGVCI